MNLPISSNISLYHTCMFMSIHYLQTPSWLAEMIDYPTWRHLFYKLAEEYPDCLMLNFTIKVSVVNVGYLK